MTTQSAQSKASKGSVGIESFQGRLRLRLPRQVYGGKQKYLSLGLDDTTENRVLANGKAKQIEADIAYERFDPTLAKYRPQTHLALVTASQEKLKPLTPSEVWEKYTDYKKPNLALHTLSSKYRSVEAMLKAWEKPINNKQDAIDLRDWKLEDCKAETVKTYFQLLKSSYDWAVEMGLVSENYFSKVEVKTNKEMDKEPDPFSATERDAIIEAFSTSTHYSRYTSYVKFLFMTGCRPAEAVGLKWKHISKDYQTITFSESVTIVSGKKIQKGTKTGKSRKFPCNESLRLLLKSIKPENCNPESSIFDIRPDNFQRRAWQGYKNRHGHQIDGIVTQLIKQGKVDHYRPPYCTRHTFITLALENGLDAKDVARLVGNSAQIIYKHYAGSNIHKLQVPEF